MAESIKWSVAFDAVLGPRIAESDTLEADAYDKVSVRLEPGATEIDVDVQPSSTAGDVSLLVITAGSYKGGVTFSADAGATKVTLDGPLALIGAGAVGLLATAPQKLQFANPDAAAVEIEILVARKVLKVPTP